MCDGQPKEITDYIVNQRDTHPDMTVMYAFNYSKGIAALYLADFSREEHLVNVIVLFTKKEDTWSVSCTLHPEALGRESDRPLFTEDISVYMADELIEVSGYLTENRNFGAGVNELSFHALYNFAQAKSGSQYEFFSFEYINREAAARIKSRKRYETLGYNIKGVIPSKNFKAHEKPKLIADTSRALVGGNSLQKHELPEKLLNKLNARYGEGFVCAFAVRTKDGSVIAADCIVGGPFENDRNYVGVWVESSNGEWLSVYVWSHEDCGVEPHMYINNVFLWFEYSDNKLWLNVQFGSLEYPVLGCSQLAKPVTRRFEIDLSQTALNKVISSFERDDYAVSG